MGSESLETWEGFSARFARTSDILIAKYLRARINESDPGFRGEVRDLVDRAEKMNLIPSADKLMEIRELRNRMAHEYAASDLTLSFKKLENLAPRLVQIVEGVLHAPDK